MPSTVCEREVETTRQKFSMQVEEPPPPLTAARLPSDHGQGAPPGVRSRLHRPAAHPRKGWGRRPLRALQIRLPAQPHPCTPGPSGAPRLLRVDPRHRCAPLLPLSFIFPVLLLLPSFSFPSSCSFLPPPPLTPSLSSPACHACAHDPCNRPPPRPPRRQRRRHLLERRPDVAQGVWLRRHHGGEGGGGQHIVLPQGGDAAGLPPPDHFAGV